MIWRGYSRLVRDGSVTENSSNLYSSEIVRARNAISILQIVPFFPFRSRAYVIRSLLLQRYLHRAFAPRELLSRATRICARHRGDAFRNKIRKSMKPSSSSHRPAMRLSARPAILNRRALTLPFLSLRRLPPNSHNLMNGLTPISSRFSLTTALHVPHPYM